MKNRSTPLSLMLVTTLASVLTTGCVNTQSVLIPANNQDIQSLNDCVQIHDRITDANENIRQLTIQQQNANANNAATLAAALLSLNPFMLINLDRQADVSEVRASYEARLQQLTERLQSQCGTSTPVSSGIVIQKQSGEWLNPSTTPSSPATGSAPSN